MMEFDPTMMTPVLGAVATATVGWWTFRTLRLHRLVDKLKDLMTPENLAALQVMAERDAQELAHETEINKPALSLLLKYNQVASSVTALPSLWDHALAYDELELLRAAVTRAKLLIETVRGTSWPFKVRAWNGSRRHAFAPLLKALRIKMPRNT